MLRAPELLLPAGSLEKMHAAFDFGADAVYAGQPRYSLRARNNEFSPDRDAGSRHRAKPMRAARSFSSPATSLPHNAKVKTYLRDMEPVIAMKPDALIMADPGLIMMVREKWPEMPIHLSVQANTVNCAAVKFWQKMGLTRVILSRELSLDEIEEIRQAMPGHGTGSVRARRAVHRLFRPLPAVRLLQPPRRQPGHLHQFLPLGLQGARAPAKMPAATLPAFRWKPSS